MSVWSAIGLADKNAVENLINQIESLRKENRELFAQNQQILSTQYYKLYTSEKEHTQFLNAKIGEIHRELSDKMEGTSRLIYQQITANSEAARNTISSSTKKIETDVSGVQAAIKVLAKMQEKTQNEMKSAFSSTSAQLEETEAHLEQTIAADGDSSRKAISQLNTQMDDTLSYVMQNQNAAKNALTSSIEELSQFVSSQNNDIVEQISQSLHQILEKQQQIPIDSCNLVADANRKFLVRIEQYCTSALEEVKKTGERYRQMEQDEQETLDKIRSLSSEMLKLGEQQKKVMEQLSQLCQDSDQFMELQKSLNDIWEIMKAVWVDSLLNDYQKSLDPKYNG